MEYLKEDWKTITVNPRYEVSSLGRIKNIATGHIMKLLIKPKKGYAQADLHLGGKHLKVRKMVHRLVAEAFLPKIPGKTLVNHRDGNKLNNQLANLEWVDYKENAQHSIYMRLKQDYGGVLSKKQVIVLRLAFEAFVLAQAEDLGVRPHTVRSVVRNETYKK